MTYQMIQSNFIGVAILLFLTSFILTNNNFDKRTNHLFLAAIVCVLLFIAEEIWENQLALEATSSQLRVLLSAIGYTLRPMTAYFLLLIIGSSSLKWQMLVSVPLVINALVAFSALFVPWAFSYTPDNQFVRGPLGFFPFVTAAFYVLAILLFTLTSTKKGDNMEAVVVMGTVLLTTVATAMESLFGFRFIQGAAGGVSITFYYLFLHTNQNNRDQLTGALVRRRFYLDAERYRTTLTAVISLDLNNLKELNDNYGHVAGDEALIVFTQTVKKCLSKRASLYRTGGDEFMILCYKMQEGEVQALIEKIRAAMQETSYRCAIGYATYHYRTGLEDRKSVV